MCFSSLKISTDFSGTPARVIVAMLKKLNIYLKKHAIKHKAVMIISPTFSSFRKKEKIFRKAKVTYRNRTKIPMTILYLSQGEIAFTAELLSQTVYTDR